MKHSFAHLLQEIRSNRRFTEEQAAQCLPWTSVETLRAWERGERSPADWIQTLVIWQLNTTSPPAPAVEARKRSVATWSVLSISLAGVVAWLALAGKLEARRAAPGVPALSSEGLAYLGAKSAEAQLRVLTDALPDEDLTEYQKRLAETLGRLSKAQQERIILGSLQALPEK